MDQGTKSGKAEPTRNCASKPQSAENEKRNRISARMILHGESVDEGVIQREDRRLF